jgi:hypothetical protein
MKLSYVSILLLTLTAHAALASSPVDSRIEISNFPPFSQREQLQVAHIFVPAGIRPNETPIVIASGWLPNPCYHSPQSEVTRQGSSIIISVWAIHNTAPFACITLAVPYLIPIPLGDLGPGTYSVKHGPDNVAAGIITIEAPDSIQIEKTLYAHVEQVNFDATTRQVKLSGRNPSDCIALERIEVISNGIDSYTVLPIMKQIRAECPKKNEPFEYSAILSDELEASDILFHVRTLNSSNDFVDILESASLPH